MEYSYEREFEIRSVEEYLEAIHKINDPRLGKFYYRGHSKKEYKLLPYIGRPIKNDKPELYLPLEKEIVSEAANPLIALFFACSSNQNKNA